MTKRKSSVKPDLRRSVPRKQYPGVQGKVVDWAEHSFEEGLLFIHVRFTDKTELCWTIRTASIIQVADLSDWKTGDFKELCVFVHGESDWE
jgi:hypothetical protein